MARIAKMTDDIFSAAYPAPFHSAPCVIDKADTFLGQI